MISINKYWNFKRDLLENNRIEIAKIMIPFRGFRRYRPSRFSGRRVRRRRIVCGLTLKDILTLLSSLALPLMLGIFTVIITFDQKNSSNKQRMEDRHLADIERDQDLNISHQQRREDRELAREQRLQDLNQSILQRELERTLADETRNISEQRHLHEFHIEVKRYHDALLTSYISEMSDLLSKNNGSLTNISLTPTLVRLKTLTLIAQVDSNRNSQVIRFLYEAGQLNAREKYPLDLSESELLGIDMSSRKYGKKMHNLYLPNVDLTNSSFVNRDLTGANFSNTILIGVNFSSTILRESDLSHTVFNGSFNIYQTALREINLSYANLERTNFTEFLLPPSKYDASHLNYILFQVNFKNANLRNTCFSGLYIVFTQFRGIYSFIDFSHTMLSGVAFEKVWGAHLNFFNSSLRDNTTFSELTGMVNSSFFMAQLTDVKFSQPSGDAIFEKIQFDFAKLQSVSFLGIFIASSSFINTTITNSAFDSVRFSNCSFNNATITNSTFDLIQFSDCSFINATMSKVKLNAGLENVNFDNAILQNDVVFSKTTQISHSSFQRAQMQNITANYCHFISLHMNGANLTNSNMFATRLISCNLTNTDFTGADLSMVNLSHSNMLNARITDEQLHSTISLENSILPNGTIAHDISLIRNGNADCNKIIEEDWIIQPPNSIVLTKWTIYNQSFSDPNDCMFRAPLSSSKNTSITMSQRMNLTRYQTIFNRRDAKILLMTDCNEYVNISLIERNRNDQILNRRTIQKQPYIYPNIQTTDIEIILLYHANSNNTGICDNIRFYIQLR